MNLTRLHRRPNYYKPNGRWTGVSPYGNPNVVYWSSAPLLARLRWRLGRWLRGPLLYRDPDSEVEWWV